MTKREFLNAIVNADLDATLKEYALQEIDKLDKRNQQKSSKPTKKQLENESVKLEILSKLEGKEPTILSEIAEMLDISTQKASALCRQLASDEKLKVTEVKVKNRGKLKAYSLA